MRPVVEQRNPDAIADAARLLAEHSPLRGRAGLAEDVANAALWLASDECSFTTGAVFDISGGRAVY